MPITRRQRRVESVVSEVSDPSKLQQRHPTKKVDDIGRDGDGDDDDDEDVIPATPTPSYIFEGVVYATYQDMVNAKRKRNQEVLQNLGFLDSKSGGGIGSMTGEAKKRATQRGLKRQKVIPEPLPRRKSSRLAADKSALIALDYYVNDWNRDTSVVKVEGTDDTLGADAATPEEPKYYKDRLNDGSDMILQDAVEMMDKKWIREDSVELANKFFQEELLKISKESSANPLGKRKSPVSVTSSSINQDLSRMVEDLSIDKEECVAKVTPDRIYSVATHPSENKLIACAGDKWGYIGLWDVDAPIKDDGQQIQHNNGVYLFRVHSRPVCCLQWATSDSLISASYDGTIRKFNVETGVFQEIFASYDDTNTYYAEELGFGLDQGHNFWHQHVSLDHRSAQADACLFVATSVGKAIHLDLRIPDKQRITFNEQLSDKKINTLSLHPNGYTLASAGNDGVVSLWDVRKFQGSKSKPGTPQAIATQHIGLSVSSSFFSPSGSFLLSTSFANKIDLIGDAHTLKGTMTPSTRIQHNNQTGRWLSTFMACWHPLQDIFVCGSMKQPRCIEIYDAKGKLLREVTGASLSAVASRCCFHPSTEKLMLVGGNSSGRMVAVR